MSVLGKYCHDFPRLAKESGYKFQLYRNRINWDDLDRVDIQQIIEERNFQLLEESLIHVINCNLEKEYDVKILDQNFVKLFKLAQLGIDYLSYCELYLDRCVILLQEQLSSYQEECTLLKDENEKKDEEIKRIKRRMKIQCHNYKCNKCDKIFLNELYLESHQNRRHKPQPGDIKHPQQSTTHQSQQTEEECTSVSAFTQTINLDNVMKTTDEPEILKMNEQELKMDDLKKDLEELKIRLSLAEKAMGEKKNDEQTFPSSFPNGVIPVIHSYISASTNGYVQVNAATPTLLSDRPSQLIVQEEITESYEPSKQVHKLQLGELPLQKYISRHVIKQEDQPINKIVTPEQLSHEVFTKSPSKNNILTYIDVNNEGSRGKTSVELSTGTSLKSKSEDEGEEMKTYIKQRGKKLQLTAEIIDNDFHCSSLGSSPTSSNNNLLLQLLDVDDPNEQTTIIPLQHKTSPKSKQTEVIDMNSSSETPISESINRERKNTSHETPLQDVCALNSHEKSKSLIRKLVTKKSPKIQEITVNLKNSFSQMYGSVSSISKNSDVQRGSFLTNTKSEIVEGLHNRLRDLGIDPEWSGIPKETMKQKLKILEHRRNLLSKENRLYPYLRKKVEKHILKKLRRNSLTSNEKTEMDLGQLELGNSQNTENCCMAYRENDTDDTHEITLYDTDKDSDVEVLTENKDSKLDLMHSPESSNNDNKIQHVSPNSGESGKLKIISPSREKDGEREVTDFSIFQAGRFKALKSKINGLELRKDDVQQPKHPNAVDELQTDSDFEDEPFHTLECSMMASKGQIKATTSSPKNDIIGSFPIKIEEDVSSPFSCLNLKSENHSILKNEAEKSQLMTKKRVLFALEPEIFDSISNLTQQTPTSENQNTYGMSVVADEDDDDWSIESEWIVNTEQRN